MRQTRDRFDRCGRMERSPPRPWSPGSHNISDLPLTARLTPSISTSLCAFLRRRLSRDVCAWLRQGTSSGCTITNRRGFRVGNSRGHLALIRRRFSVNTGFGRATTMTTGLTATTSQPQRWRQEQGVNGMLPQELQQIHSQGLV